MADNPWKALEGSLNRHGYGFQYRVAKEVHDHTGVDSPWKLLAQEFPVEVRQSISHVDMLLQRGNDSVYIVGECKRVQGPLADWCFARSALPEPDPDQARCAFEWVINGSSVSGSTGGFYCYPAKVALRGGEQPPRQYDVSLPIRMRNVEGSTTESGCKGDAGSDRDAVEKAVSQVSRGVSGLIEYWRKNHWMHENLRGLVLIPMVVTTARLWVCDKDLATASLQTGTIELTESDVRQADYVYYRSRMSPALRPDLETRTGVSQFANHFDSVLDAEFLRTIVIVNAESLLAFLRMAARWGFLEVR